MGERAQADVAERVGHTPGPWRTEIAYGTGRVFVCYEIVAATDKIVATTWSPRGKVQSTADAALIAAAPDMLAALQAVCGVYEGHDDVPLYVRKARAALAKAERR